MKLRLFPILLLACIAGCQRQPQKSPPVVQSKPASPARQPDRAVPAEARTECDTAAAIWRRLGNVKISEKDTTVMPANRNMHDPSLPEEALPARPACVVTAHVDSLAREDGKLDWHKRDWVPLLTFSADGPDGSMLTYQRGIVRCEVQERWDGGDDSDTTVVPLPFYEQEVICWRHNRRLIPTDTMSPV